MFCWRVRGSMDYNDQPMLVSSFKRAESILSFDVRDVAGDGWYAAIVVVVTGADGVLIKVKCRNDVAANILCGRHYAVAKTM